ncbi:MAG: hypothetical protein RLZ71_822 [Actinomycetota bacterium]|jgi:DNA primase
MAGRIRNSDIEEVRSRVNITDVVGEFVALRSAGGGSMKGLCPFHDEKSPSFNVSDTRGIYKCFGCGVGGNVFTFLMEYEKLSFVEAVEKMAARVGIVLTYEDGGPSIDQGQRARILEANKQAADYYAAQMLTEEGSHGRNFLKERGFSKEAGEQFGVGWAPKGWNHLSDHLRTLGFTDEELVAAALASKGDRGIYDKFRGRVVWPIRDATNQVIGFGARKIFEDDQGPKYLNTSDTLVYHKSQVLYGIDLAKKDISKKQQVVVVEGYTDVMACHLAGITTAVATCGTAFGADHIRILNRMLNDNAANPAQVIFNFDPDEAGQKAAMRAFADSSQFNAQTFVAVGPDGLDPCDLRLQRGDEAVVAMIDAKRPLIEFAIDRSMAKFDLNTREGQIAATRSAAVILASINDQLTRFVYEKYLSDRTTVDRDIITQLIAEVASKNRGAKVAKLAVGSTPPPQDEPEPMAEVGYAPVDMRDPTNRRERWLLEVATQLPEYLDVVTRKRIFKNYFSASRHVAIAKVLSEALDSGTENLIERVGSKLDSELASTFHEIAMTALPISTDDAKEKYAKGVIASALEATVELEKNILLAERTRADSAGDTEAALQLAHRIQDLDREILALRSRR